MKDSKIEWTDHTYNPWCGCTKIPGANGAPSACDHCYAEGMASRLAHNWASHHLVQIGTPKVWGKDSDRLLYPLDSLKLQEPLQWDAQAKRKGERARVFCLSMGDIMERNPILNEHRRFVFDLVERTPNLDWMFLTKRPNEYRHFLPKTWLQTPRHNVWLMTTVEHENNLWRIDELLKVPAVVHGISAEPLFSKLQLPKAFLKLGSSAWIITGGESGIQARPHNPDWFRSLRDQAKSHDCAFHFKQWGEWSPDGSEKIGKKKAGHLLDEREWNEFPVPEPETDVQKREEILDFGQREVMAEL
jgi:protein gp37